jgi:hypothetical protein
MTVPWSGVDVVALQAQQLPGAQTAESAEDDQAPEPRFDCVGQRQHRRRVEHGTLPGALHAGTSDRARVAADELITDGRVHDGPHDAVRLRRLVC